MTSTLALGTGIGPIPDSIIAGLSVIGDVSTTPNGNTMLRIGKTPSPTVLTSWTQTEHVVLTPDEREQLIAQLIAHRATPDLPDAVLTDDALTCPVEGCTADTYLVETGYERQWHVRVEDGVVKAEFGGSEDWSEYGASDDHVRCGDGHESNLPVDFNSVDYV